jgi:hypothetical protein
MFGLDVADVAVQESHVDGRRQWSLEGSWTKVKDVTPFHPESIGPCTIIFLLLATMALDRSANEDPVPEAIKADIVRGIWHRSFVTDSPADLRRWGAILTYYTAECKKAISYSRGEYTTVRTHKDIIAIVHMLENGCSKDKIAQSLFPLDTQQRSDQAKLHMVEGSLRLAARLMSMVDVGPLPHSVQGWAPAIWSNGASTLEVVLADYFRESTTTVVMGTKFSEDFTAFNFQKLAGLQIRWTNNLAHHLRLMDNDTTLCLFHHACFLKYQDRFGIPST